MGNADLSRWMERQLAPGWSIMKPAMLRAAGPVAGGCSLAGGEGVPVQGAEVLH